MSLNRIAEEDLIDELHRLAEDGVAPSTGEMERTGAFSVSTYQRRFGSWAEAVEASGLDPKRDGRPARATRAELLDAIHDLATGEEPPTSDQMKRDGEYHPKCHVREFGSWTEAVETAGYAPRHNGGVAESARKLQQMSAEEFDEILANGGGD